VSLLVLLVLFVVNLLPRFHHLRERPPDWGPFVLLARIPRGT